jgi:hypothetical protein
VQLDEIMVRLEKETADVKAVQEVVEAESLVV